MTTFRKLKSGDWGIQTDVTVFDGMTITVTKKDESIVPAKVRNVVWQGQQDGRQITLCAIEQKEKHQHNKPYVGLGARRRCSCDSDCCERGCKCESHCNCQGGNIYDC